MITFGDYVRPKSLDEACEIVKTKKPARIIGGGLYLRMGDRRIGLAVDLSDLELDYIKETDDSFEIGAMTSLRTLEVDSAINAHYGNVFKQSLKDIVGVQLRNIATVGGTVYAKYGFSDVIPALLAVNAKVSFHEAGEISLEDYLKEDGFRKDVLEKIIIPKASEVQASNQTLRISRGDYAMLVTVVTKIDGKYKVVVGARPRRAAIAEKATDYLNSNEVSEEVAIKAGELASEELVFGTNTRGTAEYREDVCKVLIKRAVMEVSSCK